MTAQELLKSPDAKAAMDAYFGRATMTSEQSALVGKILAHMISESRSGEARTSGEASK